MAAVVDSALLRVLLPALVVFGCSGKTVDDAVAMDSASAEETVAEASPADAEADVDATVTDAIAEASEDVSAEDTAPKADATLDASDGDAADSADASSCTKPGSVTASAGEIVQIGTGASWMNLGEAIHSDNVWASCSVTGGTSSMTLWARKFGITVPAAAKITGVTVNVERHKSGTPPMVENMFKLFDGAEVSFDHKGSSWPLVDAVATYGGATDTWGLPLTEANVASDMFGPRFSVSTPGGASANVDAIAMTVYYETSDCGD